jgi:ribosomal protein S18 acetylase RimI-like enzyme
LTASPRQPFAPVDLRRGRIGDLGALLALERDLFTTDQLSGRSFRHFISSPKATLIVAEDGGEVAGYVLVLYPPRSKLARVYSIAVGHTFRGRGLGSLLVTAAEDAAKRRRRQAIRLEVDEHNTRAIARYKKSGYRLFGRHYDYYDDHTHALRFEKPLGSKARPGPAPSQKKSDSRARIGFHGGHRGRRGRHSVRS